MRRARAIRFLMLGVLILVIIGSFVMASNGTRDAPHNPDAKGGHDHNGDGVPDH